ncbi:ABC transporter substrate-binding protein [Piscinibacter terrae]|uniref:ABC transporter substrate-binding protein n=1 Tax=Piscinibacter terrae TaxID=2496871 RepID=A0A3N7HIL3_9BURK|nr:ABC transporter substrate-binding protein [Albitalea terrae]RQP21877.1 ABC transporter substrate-binding protein [Albitalea terrae]
MTAWRWPFVALLLVCAVTCAQAQGRPGRISLMVGGIEKQIYLPVILASRLGYFEAQGVDVEVLTEPSGVNAEDQLLAGAVQGVIGFYDHTIDLQAKGKLVRSVVQFSRIPGEVVLVAARHGSVIRTPADLKERPVGVTGLGSSTGFLVKYLATTGGLKTSDVHPLAVGAGDSFIDAMRAGRIHAGMTTEPTASRLLTTGEAQVLVDLRIVEGTRQALGGLYPAACLYMREDWISTHRSQVRALAAALVRALQYLQTHDAQEIASLVPESFFAGNRAMYVAALDRGKEMFTTDGRMPPGGPETVLQVMRVADRHVGQRKIDLGRTYTEDFTRPPP